MPCERRGNTVVCGMWGRWVPKSRKSTKTNGKPTILLPHGGTGRHSMRVQSVEQKSVLGSIGGTKICSAVLQQCEGLICRASDGETRWCVACGADGCLSRENQQKQMENQRFCYHTGAPEVTLCGFNRWNKNLFRVQSVEQKFVPQF